MRASPECFSCLKRLALQTIELATEDPQLKSRAREQVDRILRRFSLRLVPTQLSNEFHHSIKQITGNPDPYREQKDKEIEAARRAYSGVQLRKSIRACVELAALGNAIDFFVDHKTLVRSLKETPRFAIDHVSLLKRKLIDVREILYLADNAGEAFFDLPLVKVLGEHAKVTYAVKAAPVQNDLTLEDLRHTGLSESLDNLIEAPATVGVDLEVASPEFRIKFDRADLVIAKGMGNYETLSELPTSERFFYIFRAKCKPVARSLGVDIGKYVAMLR
jgi:hypothetical protein